MADPSQSLYAFQSIARVFCGPRQPERKLRSASAWMLVAAAGSGAVFAEGRRYTLASGGALTGGPGSIVLQAEDRAEGEWKLYFVEFVPIRLTFPSPERLSAKVEEGGSPWTGCRFASDANELGTLAERLHTAVHMNLDSPQHGLNAHVLVQQMVLWWLGEAEESGGRQRTTDTAVLAALRDMESRLGEPWTREQLAAKAGIAPAYFSVYCRKLTGLSPSVYLERLRVHRAAELLLQNRDRKGDMADIARRSGFRDAWYMSRRFRNMQGAGPTSYRRDFVPERVATLEYPYTNHLLALGVKPAAARFGGAGEAIRPGDREGIAEIPALLSEEGRKQLLLRHEPQLVVTYGSEPLRDGMRSVAPVVHLPWLPMNWREHMQAFGRLLRREAEAAERIAALDRQAETIRDQAHRLFPPETTISLFKIENKRCYLYGIRDMGCIFYEFLGYSPHPYMRRCLEQDTRLHSVEISLRQMADYAGDLNFVVLYPDEGGQGDFLRANEHWRDFEVKAGRAIAYMDYREWLHYDPLNFALQLEKVVPLLEQQSQWILTI
ncbi:helix-turn-helix domain-containing protein [Cohnella cellulosilytica]|uniref:Helix-turn-helix domain-containing protein n=1 Tax=Cohnella cellulosilytica TaxID=986710 RepID=A0ABW2FJR9_9BACL